MIVTYRLLIVPAKATNGDTDQRIRSVSSEVTNLPLVTLIGVIQMFKQQFALFCVGFEDPRGGPSVLI